MLQYLQRARHGGSMEHWVGILGWPLDDLGICKRSTVDIFGPTDTLGTHIRAY